MTKFCDSGVLKNVLKFRFFSVLKIKILCAQVCLGHCVGLEILSWPSCSCRWLKLFVSVQPEEELSRASKLRAAAGAPVHCRQREQGSWYIAFCDRSAGQLRRKVWICITDNEWLPVVAIGSIVLPSVAWISWHWWWLLRPATTTVVVTCNIHLHQVLLLGIARYWALGHVPPGLLTVWFFRSLQSYTNYYIRLDYGCLSSKKTSITYSACSFVTVYCMNFWIFLHHPLSFVSLLAPNPGDATGSTDFCVTTYLRVNMLSVVPHCASGAVVCWCTVCRWLDDCIYHD